MMGLAGAARSSLCFENTLQTAVLTIKWTILSTGYIYRDHAY